MPVNVGEMISSVTPEPEVPVDGGPETGGEPEWRHAARLREMDARIRRDHRRTAAEGFDD